MDVHFSFGDGNGGYLLIALFVAYSLAWVGFIAAILSRKGMDSIERLTWLIAVIFVPLFGVLLYLFLAPSGEEQKRINLASDVAGTPWQNDPGHTG